MFSGTGRVILAGNRRDCAIDKSIIWMRKLLLPPFKKHDSPVFKMVHAMSFGLIQKRSTITGESTYQPRRSHLVSQPLWADHFEL